MFWKTVSRTAAGGLDRLAGGPGDDLAPLSREELARIEGGRARVSARSGDDPRRLPTGEVLIDVPAP
jgi:hypothetical protein